MSVPIRAFSYKRSAIKAKPKTSYDSFITQCNNRVNAHGAARGNEACAESNQDQERGGREEAGGVEHTDAVEQRAHTLGEQQGQPEAHDYAAENHGHAVAENQTEDGCWLRTESHANADFVAPLVDRIGHYAVSPDGGENESEEAKGAEQFSAHERRRERLLEHLRNGSNESQVERWRHRMNHVANRGNCLCGIALCVDPKRHARGIVLLQRHIHKGLGRLAERREFHRVHFADDGDDPRLTEEMQMLTDGIFSRPEGIGGGTVDNGDHATVRVVARSKVAAFAHGNGRSGEISRRRVNDR